MLIDSLVISNGRSIKGISHQDLETYNRLTINIK